MAGQLKEKVIDWPLQIARRTKVEQSVNQANHQTMLTRIRKLWRLFSYFIHARKTWHWPRQSDVLIYDADGHEFMSEYLDPWKPAVLHMRGEQINMPVLLASLAASGQLSRDSYIDQFVRKVCPRLIVTFIDNDPAFYSLAVRHQNVKTLFIQNGVKSYYLDVFEILDRTRSSRNSLRVDYMMTFGSRPGAEYAKYIQGTVVPMGSLRNNLVPKCHAKKAGTIAFISQYRETKGFVMGGKFCSRQAFFEQADQLVLSCLVKYAKDHGKEFFIVPCSGYLKDGTLKKEQEYYNKLLGQACCFSEWRWHGSSYEAADSAEVLVTIDSALGYESAARGNKTAFFAIKSRLLDVPGLTYGWPKTPPDEGTFCTNCPNPVVFERILDHLFAINDEQWHAELAEHGFASIMAYDPGNTILQSVLRKELGEPSHDC